MKNFLFGFLFGVILMGITVNVLDVLTPWSDNFGQEPSPAKPELEPLKTSPPKDWTIEYNVDSNRYRACYPSGHCFGEATTHLGAVRMAWDQYRFEEREKKDRWQKVKEEGK